MLKFKLSNGGWGFSAGKFYFEINRDIKIDNIKYWITKASDDIGEELFLLNANLDRQVL